jgi:hypothetical protein
MHASLKKKNGPVEPISERITELNRDMGSDIHPMDPDISLHRYQQSDHSVY